MPDRLLLALFSLICFALPAQAACRQHALTPPEAVKFAGDTAMLVVHQSSAYDARVATKRGVDEAMRFARARGIPRVYLQDDTPDEYYFMADCEPDYWVFSQGGEVSFAMTPSQLYVVGGHLELCLSTALHDILYQWAQRPPRNYTITFFMDAIYSNGKLIDPAAPYYRDFERFMGIVTYGRPGGEHWPKISLLETMGIIVDPENELAYLKDVLPRWDTTFPPDYRVEVQLNDSVKKVLRPAAGWNPPTVLFRFVDSALGLSDPLPPRGD